MMTIFNRSHAIERDSCFLFVNLIYVVEASVACSSRDVISVSFPSAFDANTRTESIKKAVLSRKSVSYSNSSAS